MTEPLLFISHSSADAGAARELRQVLEDAGYRCWLAPDDVTGIDPWAEQILAAIERSRAMVILVSARANQSSHVSREVQLASSRGRVILPLRLEPVTPAGALEYHLAGLQRIDAFPPPIRAHRDEIVRRLALTVPLAAPATGEGRVEITTRATTPVTRTPPARGGFSAWARANSMLAGAFVTLAALFLVATLAFALSTPGSTPSPGHTARTTGPGASATAALTMPPTPSPTPDTPSTFPPVSGGPFPNDAELALFEAIPDSGKSVIEACDRNDSTYSGAVVGIACNADDRELLFYEGYPDVATLREQYFDLVRGSFGGADGSCSTSPVGDEVWSGSDGRFGRLACGVNDLGLYFFYWIDESRLMSVSWYAGYDVDLDAERANGYEVFLKWSGG